MLFIVRELACVDITVCVGVLSLTVTLTIEVLAFVDFAVGVGGCGFASVGFGGVCGLLAFREELIWLLLFGLLFGHDELVNYC